MGLMLLVAVTAIAVRLCDRRSGQKDAQRCGHEKLVHGKIPFLELSVRNTQNARKFPFADTLPLSVYDLPDMTGT